MTQIREKKLVCVLHNTQRGQSLGTI